MRKEILALIFLVGVALISTFLPTNASSADKGFDEYGNLTPQASRQFFEKIKPSLIEAVGDEKYLADPFPEMYMSSGYFRRHKGILLFVNPTFGMLTIFTKPSDRPYSVGVTELFKLVGSPPDVEPSNLSARYVYFTKYIDLFLNTYGDYPLIIAFDLKDSDRYRDVGSNKVFVSDPIMRAANPDVKACYADFPYEAYNKKINEKLEQESARKQRFTFEPVDLVPLPDDEGLLVLSTNTLRTLFVFVPIKRSQGRCTFAEPTYGVHNW